MNEQVKEWNNWESYDALSLVLVTTPSVAIRASNNEYGAEFKGMELIITGAVSRKEIIGAIDMFAKEVRSRKFKDSLDHLKGENRKRILDKEKETG